MSDLVGELVAEVRVVRTATSRQRWRWDVIWQRRVEGQHAGVYDGRQHQDHDCGYALTRRSAWRHVRRAYRRPPELAASLREDAEAQP